MSVWSSRGQTYRSSSWGTISCFSFGALWFANDTAPPTFFYVLLIIYSRKMQKSFIFINHGLCWPCYSLRIWQKISRAFRFCASCRSDRVLSMLFNSCLDALAHSVTEMVGFSFLSSNVLKFDKLLLSFKWQQFCNEKAKTWFGLYGFPSYPLSSVYFQRSSILRRKKKKKEVAVCHRSESTV